MSRIVCFILAVIMAINLKGASTEGFSSHREIIGYVVDENNEPLPGASVRVQGTVLGAVTDTDGKFLSLIHISEPTRLL